MNLNMIMLNNAKYKYIFAYQYFFFKSFIQNMFLISIKNIGVDVCDECLFFRNNQEFMKYTRQN